MISIIKRFYTTIKLSFNSLVVSIYNYVLYGSMDVSESEYVLYCHDDNRGIRINNLAYAQILDSYRDLYLPKNQRIPTIAPYGSLLVRDKGYGFVYGPKVCDCIILVISTFVDALSFGKTSLRNRAELLRYSNILKRVKPRFLIGIQPPAMLINAATQLNIKIYDIQHGDIAPGVPYYEIFCKKSIKLNFLLWDDVSKDILQNHFGILSNRLQVIGNPFNEAYRKSLKTDGNFFNEQVRKISAHLESTDRPKVLVTLQYGLKKMYPYDFCNDHIPTCLLDSIKAHQEVVWCLRTHPVTARCKDQLRSLKYLIANYKNVILIDPLEFALPVVLSACNKHITWHSSSVIEASDLGVKSLVLCSEPYNYSFGKLNVNERIIKPYEQYKNNSLIFWADEKFANKTESINNFIFQ